MFRHHYTGGSEMWTELCSFIVLELAQHAAIFIRRQLLSRPLLLWFNPSLSPFLHSFCPHSSFPIPSPSLSPSSLLQITSEVHLSDRWNYVIRQVMYVGQIWVNGKQSSPQKSYQFVAKLRSDITLLRNKRNTVTVPFGEDVGGGVKCCSFSSQ